MPMQKIHTFLNCGVAVEDVHNPNTGLIEGRAFVIIDPETQDVYRVAMAMDQAKIQGQRLMGIGAVEVPTGQQAAKIINGAGGKKR